MKREAKNLLQLLILFLCVGTLRANAQKEVGVGGSVFHKNDITYSTEVVTPHVAWATQLERGPIKGFFIPSVAYGRDMVELMQRLSLAPTTVSIDRNWDVNCWGIGDYYGHEYRGDRDDFQEVFSYVERDLTGPANFEVILIPGLNGWSHLTRASRDAILHRVKEGAGLVLIHPYVGDVKNHPFKGDERVGDERIWDLSPLVGVPDDTINERGYPEINKEAVSKGKWEIAAPHFITDGLPLDLLPEGNQGGSYYKYKSLGDVLIKAGSDPILAVRNYGKGRVVALGYVEEGFTPQSIDPVEAKIYWDYWEYQYMLLTRCVLWAAGREGDLRISTLTAQNDAKAVIKLELAATSNRRIAIEVSGKNESGQIIGAARLEKEIKSGPNTIDIPASAFTQAPNWPGGKQIFNIIIRDATNGATLNMGAATFQTPKKAMLTMLEPAVDVYQRGETLSATIRAAGELSNLKMRLKVEDDYGRLLAIPERPARGERVLTYQLEDYLGKSAYLTAELVDQNGLIIDQLRAKPVLVVQSERRPQEYTPLVSFAGTKHYLNSAQMKMVRSAAAETGFTWGSGVDNSLNIPRGTFGVYWYDRGPTTPEGMEKAIADYERTGDYDALGYLTKKELYKRTGDRRFLRRTPSFNDPAFMKTLTGIVSATARNKARYQMDYYFVGDEGSLTSYGDPFDFDWSEQSINDFRAWLKSEYGSLPKLNAEWKTNYTDWNSILPATTEEAKKSGNYAAWSDHRTFMEITFARAYQEVRAAVVAADPQAHIAVSGTQATNAYNGADWYRLDQVIDDFLSYDGGNQWDLHRSFAKPQAMIGFWTGYGSHGLAVQNAIWNAAVNNVLHPNIFWMYSFLNPDLTHSKSARDMGTAFRSLKYDGIGQLLMQSERLGDGVAVHYSMPSIHAASILDYHRRVDDDEDQQTTRQEDPRPNFPANRDGWVRAVKDTGLQFNFVSSEQIEKGALAGTKYRAMILPFSLALSHQEISALKKYVSEGGMLIADAGVGLMDEHCAWRDDDELNQLFGISPPAPRGRTFGKLKGTVSLTPAALQWNLTGTQISNLEAAETGLKAISGNVLARVGETDAIIANRVGHGWAIYLNTHFDRYPKQRGTREGGDTTRNLNNSLLAHAGVKPQIQIQTPDGKQLTQAQVVRYRFGSSEILALVKDNVAAEGVVGRDGVTVYNGANLGQVARQDLTIKLPQRVYVTDLRSGKSLGHTDVVKLSVKLGDAVLLGLSETQNKLQIRGPAAATLGEHARFTLTTSATDEHLVRCSFFSPAGASLDAYAKNVLLKNGVGTITLPSALNDLPGTYSLRIKDIVTGAEAETKIDLR